MNKLKILVIDDNPIVLKSCRRILESENYLVTLSSSVSESIEILKKEKFKLIIIDIVMPEYNGMDLAMKIKKDQPDMKTLTMSGYIEPEPFSEIMNKMETNFLSKPFTPEELLNAVEKTIIETPGDNGIFTNQNTEGDIK